MRGRPGGSSGAAGATEFPSERIALAVVLPAVSLCTAVLYREVCGRQMTAPQGEAKRRNGNGAGSILQRGRDGVRLRTERPPVPRGGQPFEHPVGHARTALAAEREQVGEAGGELLLDRRSKHPAGPVEARLHRLLLDRGAGRRSPRYPCLRRRAG